MPGHKNAYSTRNASTWRRRPKIPQAHRKDDRIQPSPEVANGRCGPSNDVVRARDILKMLRTAPCNAARAGVGF